MKRQVQIDMHGLLNGPPAGGVAGAGSGHNGNVAGEHEQPPSGVEQREDTDAAMDHEV